MANMIVASGATDLNSDSSRRVTIEVEGGDRIEMMRTGVSTMTIPYSCFSQAMQGIHRSGGRVTRVTVSQPDISKVESRFKSQSISESVIQPAPQQAEPVSPKVQPQQSQSAKSSNKHPQGFKPTTGNKGKS